MLRIEWSVDKWAESAKALERCSHDLACDCHDIEVKSYRPLRSHERDIDLVRDFPNDREKLLRAIDVFRTFASYAQYEGMGNLQRRVSLNDLLEFESCVAHLNAAWNQAFQDILAAVLPEVEEAIRAVPREDPPPDPNSLAPDWQALGIGYDQSLWYIDDCVTVQQWSPQPNILQANTAAQTLMERLREECLSASDRTTFRRLVKSHRGMCVSLKAYAEAAIVQGRDWSGTRDACIEALAVTERALKALENATGSPGGA